MFCKHIHRKEELLANNNAVLNTNKSNLETNTKIQLPASEKSNQV